MTSRAEAILHELVSDPALAWRVLAALPDLVGPWMPLTGGWGRRNNRGGLATIVHGYPATLPSLARADDEMRRRYPGALVVGGLPAVDAHGIVPPCDEMHPMALADGLRWPPPERTETVRCELPAGHLMACGGHGADGRQYTAANAVSRGRR